MKSRKTPRQRWPCLWDSPGKRPAEPLPTPHHGHPWPGPRQGHTQPTGGGEGGYPHPHPSLQGKGGLAGEATPMGKVPPPPTLLAPSNCTGHGVGRIQGVGLPLPNGSPSWTSRLCSQGPGAATGKVLQAATLPPPGTWWSTRRPRPEAPGFSLSLSQATQGARMLEWVGLRRGSRALASGAAFEGKGTRGVQVFGATSNAT